MSSPRHQAREAALKALYLWEVGRTDPARAVDTYFEAHDLPRHPLEAEGYPSIGCSPCTSKVQPGEDPRSGRWRGWDKTECGIHTEVTPILDDPANDPAF